MPEGRFGNVTFIITRAAKKVGTLVKMKRAKSSLQVHFSEQSLDDEDEDEDELEEEKISIDWASRARAKYKHWAKVLGKKEEGPRKEKEKAKAAADGGQREVILVLSTPQNLSGLGDNGNLPTSPYFLTNFPSGEFEPFMDESDSDHGPDAFRSDRMWKQNMRENLNESFRCPNAVLRVRSAGGIGVALPQTGTAKRKFLCCETAMLFSQMKSYPLVLVVEAVGLSDAEQPQSQPSALFTPIDVPDVPAVGRNGETSPCT